MTFFDQSIKMSKVGKKIESWMKRNDIPGVAVLLYLNAEPYSYYFGVESFDTQIPVTDKTVFEIGSLTKIFTSLLLVQMINENKLNLSDSITEYLPYLSRYSNVFQQVTVRMLATHTAGLPMMVPNHVQRQSDLPAYLAHFDLLCTPGAEWRYSNVGTGLLGNIIEAVTKKDINSLYIDYLLQPLGMQKIGINVPKSFLFHYAQGYSNEGYHVPHTHYAQYYDSLGKANSQFESCLLPGSGAMKMVASDGLPFLKAAIGMPDISSKIIDLMKITQMSYLSTIEMNQGFGWVIYPLNQIDKKAKKKLLNPNAYMNRWPEPANIIHDPIFDGDALIEKTGLTSGFRSYIGVIPNKQSGIIILTNRFALNNEIMKLGRSILFENTQLLLS